MVGAQQDELPPSLEVAKNPLGFGGFVSLWYIKPAVRDIPYLAMSLQIFPNKL
jgi:hypothetical protein